MFGKNKKIDFEEYTRINQEISSEMFLSLMTLFQTTLPCSTNYYRYKNNYEQYCNNGQTSQDKDNESEKEVVKTIASPKLMSKLSPISEFISKQGINVNPHSQKGLLKYAAVKKDVQIK